jgi:RnfABCDGE-type electron transport complex G subunit
MKQVLRLAGILLAVTAVMAALLAGVNAITAGPIRSAREEKALAAIEAVLPGAGKAEEISFTDETGLVRRVYVTDAGYAVQTTPAGFGGEISLMVGVDSRGTVLGISVISHAETPSLGAVAAQDNAWITLWGAPAASTAMAKRQEILAPVVKMVQASSRGPTMISTAKKANRVLTRVFFQELCK